MDNSTGQDNPTESVNTQAKQSPKISSGLSKSQEQNAQTNGNHRNSHSDHPTTNDNVSKESKNGDKSDKSKEEKRPTGGFDATPIPRSPPGWTIKITVHRAVDLPPADMNTMSSDPYVLAQLYCNIPTRHKEDPPLQWRSLTVQKRVNPEWNEEWIVANVPSTGFKLKCRLYDEDPSDYDDRLGNAHINVSHIDENWKGITEESFRVKKRMGSKRAYFIQAVSIPIRKRHVITPHLILSIKLLGRTETEHGGRMYTVGPMRWMKHHSPLLGRIVNRKTPTNDGPNDEDPERPTTERYNFQANQFQLCGPVPAELYHRYVEFRPFVKGMFTGAGLRGFFLHKALSHQHSQIYRFDKHTECGYLSEKPSREATMKFLDLVHYDEGGRVFTYIITLDALWRFTETGKEFGIDMLSKHTMHSDVSIYVAFSGEFFVRRRPYALAEPQLGNGKDSNKDVHRVPSAEKLDPSSYELVIDNDSGTYRPNGDLLPKLKDFLSFNLPGLHIMTLDCQKDAELEEELKKKQRERKTEEMGNAVFLQANRSGSISSSDESDLDDMVAGRHEASNIAKTVKRDLSMRGNLKAERLKKYAQVPGKEVVNSDALRQPE